ncbi:hypothetical protein [Streptomyces tauricus]|uniref:hypothetical protein n=1 Tax=Streptomyces tauricus TaxID=68274 RepID=UPI0033BD623C
MVDRTTTDSATAPTAIEDKFAAVETLYRYAAGLDLRYEELLASAFADDAVADFGPATKKAGQEYPPIKGGGPSPRPCWARSDTWTPRTR